MNKQWLISYLINDSQNDGNTLNNIQTPHNKRDMYIKHLDTVLEEELHGSLQRQIRSTIGKHLDSGDLDKLYRGSKQGRCRNANYVENFNNDSDEANGQSESEDENYDPLIDLDVAEGVDEEYNDVLYDEELEHELVNILDTSDEDEGDTFLSDVLQHLRKLKSKTDWESVDIEQLLTTYLLTYDGAMCLTHQELNTISTLILTYTGREIFKKSNNKMYKVNKLVNNMKGIPSHEFISPRKQQNRKMKQPK